MFERVFPPKTVFALDGENFVVSYNRFDGKVLIISIDTYVLAASFRNDELDRFLERYGSGVLVTSDTTQTLQQKYDSLRCSTGDVIRFANCNAVLVLTGKCKVCAVDFRDILTLGNRFRDPKDVEDPSAITIDEMKTIIGTTDFRVVGKIYECNEIFKDR